MWAATERRVFIVLPNKLQTYLRARLLAVNSAITPLCADGSEPFRPVVNFNVSACGTRARAARPAVFLGETRRLVVQQVEHGLGGAAEPGAAGRHDDRPIDQDRVLHHGVGGAQLQLQAR